MRDGNKAFCMILSQYCFDFVIPWPRFNCAYLSSVIICHPLPPEC